jgi:hypothetical protein
MPPQRDPSRENLISTKKQMILQQKGTYTFGTPQSGALFNIPEIHI